MKIKDWIKLLETKDPEKELCFYDIEHELYWTINNVEEKEITEQNNKISVYVINDFSVIL